MSFYFVLLVHALLDSAGINCLLRLWRFKDGLPDDDTNIFANS